MRNTILRVVRPAIGSLGIIPLALVRATRYLQCAWSSYKECLLGDYLKVTISHKSARTVVYLLWSVSMQLIPVAPRPAQESQITRLA